MIKIDFQKSYLTELSFVHVYSSNMIIVSSVRSLS
jgi:hypothetical protein